MKQVYRPLTAFSSVVLLFIFAFCLAANSSENEEKHESAHDSQLQWKVLKAHKPAKESLIPSELISKIKEGFGEEELEKTFMSSEVYFFDSHGVIDPPVKIMTPLGGGTIDLGSILPEGKAKFTMRIKLTDTSGGEIFPDQVYFVPKISHVVKDKEQNCDKYFDVTSFFKSSLGTEAGFETYLTHGLYATNFIGSFVFVKKLPEEKEVLLGNINFVDDRFSKSACTL